MAKPDNTNRIFQISPEQCAMDVRGAAAMRAACDAFFRRRGLNIYGGTSELANNAVSNKGRKRKTLAQG